MDYEDSFISAPVRYALDDHDSDEELEASKELAKVTFKVDVAENNNNTLILGLAQPGSVYINSLQDNTESLGKVYRLVEDKEQIKADILQLKDQPVSLISFHADISPEEAGQCTRSILTHFKHVTKMVVLDSFTAVGYISEVWGDDLTPPFLRVLHTSPASPVDLALFEPPNMIKGLSASIINYCEIHGIACYDLLTLQESIYGKLIVTTEILSAYTAGLKSLGLHLTLDENKVKQGLVDDSHHRLYL